MPTPEPLIRLRARLCPLLGLLGLLGLSGLLGMACAGPPSGDSGGRVDLIQEFRLAKSVRETGRIDFGDPSARAALRAGWSTDRHDQARDESFVVNTSTVTALDLQIVDRRALTLVISCRSQLPGPLPRLSFELNGESVGQIALERVASPAYRLELPAESMVLGPNRLTIRHVAGGDDGGVPRVAWYELAVEGAGAIVAPEVVSDQEMLFIPPSTRVAYLMDLDGGTALEVDAWRSRGLENGALDIVLETDEEGARVLATIDARHRPRRIDLALGESRVGRLSFRVTGRPEADSSAGYGIVAPRLLRPARNDRWVAGPEPPAGRPNILLYMVDTLRADHLGAYGYSRGTSPALDAFAERATLYEQAIGQSSWTRASVASVLTGVWPAAHGAVGRRDRLVDEATTLAEVLREHGYRTQAIVTNPNVYRTFGFSQGFDDFVHLRGLKTRSSVVNKGVFEMLDEGDREAPFFLYAHTVDPHNPYLPPERFRQRFAPDSEGLAERIRAKRRQESWQPEDVPLLLDLYDAEIAANDASFGELIAGLEVRGLYDNTLILFTSDHGEEFLDHGQWTHGRNLHAETLNVPLVAKFPGQSEGARVTQPAQHIDLMPTVLEWAGIERPAHLRGRRLPGSDPGSGHRAPLEVFSHLHLDGPRSIGVQRGRWKLIQRWSKRGDRVERRLLFDTETDPGETKSLASERPILAEFLESRIAAELLDGTYRLESVEAELDPELEKSLKALGYLQ